MAISLEQLRQRKRHLETEISKLVKEKEHIDYIFKHFAEPEEQQLSMLTAQESFSATNKADKLKVVQEILKTSDVPLKSSYIHRTLEERGITLKKTTFDAYMSMWVGDPEAGIRRPAPGMYEYSKLA